MSRAPWEPLGEESWTSNLSAKDKKDCRLYTLYDYSVNPDYYLEGNYWINNIQIKIDSEESYYRKENAINEFASDLYDYLWRCEMAEGYGLMEDEYFTNPQGNPMSQYLTKYFLIPIPTSKRRGSPYFDRRIHDVVQRVSDNPEEIFYFPILETVKDRPSLKQGGARNIQDIYESIGIANIAPEVLDEACKPYSIWVLVDDVITSGATYKAALRKIKENFDVKANMAFFWAKAVDFC